MECDAIKCELNENERCTVGIDDTETCNVWKYAKGRCHEVCGDLEPFCRRMLGLTARGEGEPQ